jgi:cell division inhibitor SulA
VTGTVGGKVAEQVMKLAVERMRHPNPTMAVPALQLLLSCMYTGRNSAVLGWCKDVSESSSCVKAQSILTI